MVIMTKADYEKAKKELSVLRDAILKRKDEMYEEGYPQDIINNAVFKMVQQERELEEAIRGYELNRDAEVVGAPA